MDKLMLKKVFNLDGGVDNQIEKLFESIIDIMIKGAFSVCDVKHLKTVNARELMYYFKILNFDENIRKLLIDNIYETARSLNDDNMESYVPLFNKKYCYERFKTIGDQQEKRLGRTMVIYFTSIIDVWCKSFVNNIDSLDNYNDFIGVLHMETEVVVSNERLVIKPIDFLKAINLEY